MLAAPSLLFVHSPLVGPSSLRPLAAVAGGKGFPTVTPDLKGVATAARPQEFYISAAIEAGLQLEPPIFVVGHSGAGPFLPTIGAALGTADVADGQRQVGGLVFIDAAIPPRQGRHRTSDRLKQMLDSQAEDGLLRPWLDWWEPDVVAELLPDPANRDVLAADIARLPRAFYEAEIPVPTGWSESPCGFVRLSSAYETDRLEATTRQWPTVTLDSTHLGVFTDPDLVMNAVNRLLIKLS